MKIFIVFIIFFSFFGNALANQANDPLKNNYRALKLSVNSRKNFSDIFTQSKEISSEISKVVGVSISPLFGMGVLGLYGYLNTPESKRDKLPWFNSPNFWIPIFIIVILFISKDFLASVIPILQPLKKPLDAIENFENIISALIALPIVLSLFNNINPELFEIFSSNITSGISSFFSSSTFLGVFDAGVANWTGMIFLIIVGAIAFVIVWFASHSINVLILLSPFGIIDIVLRLLRLIIIGILAASTAIHPLLGLLCCVIIIFIAYRIFGWSFRLMVFGTIFSTDILSKNHKKLRFNPNKICAFSCRGVSKLPARTYGYLKKSSESTLEFVYKPWLIFPFRKFSLSDKPANYQIGQGLINPVIIKLEENRKSDTVLFRLLPRYKSHEEKLAKALSIYSIRELYIARGMRHIHRWIAEQVGA
jgi:hypothetical protein